MKAPGVRLFLAIALFIVWTGWLVYLIATTSRLTRPPHSEDVPIVLSRPQFLVSQLGVIARVEKPTSGSTELLVKEVPWPERDKGLVGKKILLEGLSQCAGFTAPDDYILPLTREGDRYQITPLPRSPGFSSTGVKPRIYRVTPHTRWQLDAIHK